MTPALIAWMVVCGSVVLLLVLLWRATRDLRAPYLKSLLGWWLALVLTVPAQIPEQTDALAPAWLVFLFEALFQGAGAAGPSGRIVLAATTAALLLGLATGALLARRRGRVAASPDAGRLPARSA